MNITDLFFKAAKSYPNKTAIVAGSHSITFLRLEKEVKETAQLFYDKGIRPGDRVLVFVPMSIDLYRIVLALFYMGATAVFLDEWVSKKRMEVCCEVAQCKGFIGVWKARVLRLFSKELRQIPIHLPIKIKKQNRLMEYAFDVPIDHTALITFTTGSTGVPKAANRSHQFLAEQFKALLLEIDPDPNEIDLPVLPIVLFINLGVGCTSVIADFKMSKPHQLKSKKILSQLADCKVTRITASPFFVQKVAEYMLEQQIALPLVKKVFTGGAPVFPKDAVLLQRAFKAAVTTIAYGSTEAEPISTITTDKLIAQADALSKGLPVGTMYQGAAVRVIKITEEELYEIDPILFDTLTLPEGDIGEIIVSGHHVLKSYFNNEKAFHANKIKLGEVIWHRTGDSGFVENGELFLTGRCKQLIKRSDRLISPFLVENMLTELEGVVIGTLIETQKKELVLAVEGGISEQAIEAQLVDKNLPFDRLVKLKMMPRDPRHHSKIDYDQLKSILYYYDCNNA